MVLTTMHVAWFIATIPVLLAVIKMCWNVAEFAISARKDISTLTETVGKIEKKLDEGMAALQDRVTALERKEEVRHAIEEDHNGV